MKSGYRKISKEVRDFCRPLTSEEILRMVRDDRRIKDMVDRLVKSR